MVNPNILINYLCYLRILKLVFANETLDVNQKQHEKDSAVNVKATVSVD